jgi:hypothetical protein
VLLNLVSLKVTLHLQQKELPRLQFYSSYLKEYIQQVLLSKLKKQVAGFEYDEAQQILDLVKKNIIDNSVIG